MDIIPSFSNSRSLGKPDEVSFVFYLEYVMRTFFTALSLVLGISAAFAQISKVQVYEMVEKGLDESVIVAILENNCVDFEIDGQMVVELSSRVSPEILRTIIDCVKNKKADLEASAPMADKQGAVVASATAKIGVEPVAGVMGFKIPSYILLKPESNKSSYRIAEIDFRIISVSPGENDSQNIRYRFAGDSEEEEIRCYKKAGPDQLEPGEYIAYLHVVSNRKKGLMGKQATRSDLHKFRVEYTGAGPIELQYFSREEKAFRSKQAVSIEVHGPMSFFSEEHVAVDKVKNFEDMVSMFGG